jgi:GntR family transcriptional regulator
MTEDKSSARWRQVTELMRSDIADGHYQPGHALPGEAHLADQYATSRPTVRKAIAQLVNEGLLTVAHGRGTFVRARPDRRLIAIGREPHPDLLSPSFDLAAAGWEPVTVPSDAERDDAGLGHREPIPNPCGINEAEVLRIGRGSTVIYRYAYWQHAKTRTRIYVESNVPADLVGRIQGTGLSRSFAEAVPPEDYYGHLAELHGPIRWTTCVQSAMPSGDMIEDLGMEPAGTPLLVIRRVMLGADGRPLEYTELQAPGDRYEAVNAHEYEDNGHADDYTALRL